MRKCLSRYFLTFGLITTGTMIVLFLQLQRAEHSASQNTNNQPNIKVEISQTVSEVSEMSEEKIFESLMMERREVMRTACHQTGLDKKDRGDYLHRTSVEHCSGQRFRCCYVSSLTP